MAQPSTASSTTITNANTSSNTSSISIQALLEARPPASDKFTYLTLIEEHLSPEVLPTLHNVLQDASLTQELGWDLVDMLVPLLPASEACLDDVARLGNPREVILKVLEVLERLRPSKQSDDDDDGDFEAGIDQDPELDEDQDQAKLKIEPKEDEATTQTFVALLGMLALLHRRLKTKYPSRFLETTLRTILSAYQPDRPAMTTAVLGLVRSLAARRRPAPPIRRSDSQLSELALARTNSNTVNPGSSASIVTSTLEADPASNSKTSAIGKVGTDHAGRSDDSAVSVPDPEADDQVAPSEGTIQQRLLQSFLTCIIDAYVNANDMAWAPRLIEYYNPKKLVPGRPTEMHAFRENPEKIARDQAVSQMVALALDLGLKYSDALVSDVSSTSDGGIYNPVHRRPFAELLEDVSSQNVHDIPLSTGGVICLLAYWVFAADVFKADAAMPNLRMFPDHHAMIENFFDGNAAAQITQTPGTVEALVAIGLWLNQHGLFSDGGSEIGDEFLPYHHSLTLCAAFHPSLAVRNAATTLAGAVLHANPDAEDRLKILQDLLENCMFSSLKACAVSWLREEILAAAAISSKDGKEKEANLFTGSDAVEQLQYAIFPDLQELQVAWNASTLKANEEDEDTALLEYWMQNSPFLLQAANFAYFLFCSDQLKGTVVPPGMGAAIEQRYVEPLQQAAVRLRKLLGDGTADEHSHDKEASPFQHITMDLDILTNRLSSIKFA